jgi:hypothetical protein
MPSKTQYYIEQERDYKNKRKTQKQELLQSDNQILFSTIIDIFPKIN